MVVAYIKVSGKKKLQSQSGIEYRLYIVFRKKLKI